MKLPEYKLELIPKDEEAVKARQFSSGFWEELGQRFKIGGTPDFIQDEEWPICKSCGKKMTFYAQLDAIGSTLDDCSKDIGDCGLIYVFYCFDCEEAYSFVQSY